MNKPNGVVCTLKDEMGRTTIFDLIKHKEIKIKHLFYAGRLDYKTEGAIFITNDGEFANLITHPRYNVLKHYYAEIKGEILDKDIEHIKKGIHFEGEFYKIKDIKIISRNKKFSALTITLNEGKNREIRKIFQITKYKIKYLKRYKIGPFEIPQDLLPGYYKLISRKEIEKFKNSINDSTEKWCNGIRRIEARGNRLSSH